MISILIVNYKTKNYILKLIPSILDKIPNKKEIIIVDNNSGDDLEDIKEFDKSIKIIYSKKNNGFGSGINLGAKLTQGEWLFVINPDTLILDNPLPKLSSLDSNIAMLGLNLVNSNNQIQAYQFGEFPTPFSLIFNKSKLNWDTNPDNELFPDWIGGGAFLIRKEIFDKVGGYDDRYFMYYEDIDLCYRLKQNNFKIIWAKNLKIWHHEGGAEPLKFRTKQRYYKSQRQYIAKFHSKLWLPVFFILHQILLWKLYLNYKK